MHALLWVKSIKFHGRRSFVWSAPVHRFVLAYRFKLFEWSGLLGIRNVFKVKSSNPTNIIISFKTAQSLTSVREYFDKLLDFKLNDYISVADPGFDEKGAKGWGSGGHKRGGGADPSKSGNVYFYIGNLLTWVELESSENTWNKQICKCLGEFL